MRKNNFINVIKKARGVPLVIMLFCSLFFTLPPAEANNLAVSAVSLTGLSVGTGTVKVQFNLSQENSWRDATILTRNFKMKEGVLEFKARAEANAAIQGIIQQPQEKTVSGFGFKEVFYSSAYPGAEHTIAINDVAKLNIGKPIQAGADYIYKVSVNASGASFERYSPDYEKQVQLKFLDAGLSSAGFIGLKTDASFLGDGLVYFDWVRSRPYVEIEPKVEVRNE